MKKIVILGSTGSIGTQALDIIRDNKDRFTPVGLTCGSNINKLLEQIEEFTPSFVAVSDEEKGQELKCILSEKSIKLDVYIGDEGQLKAASYPCDIVLNSLMGMRGLLPTLKAIESGNDIALANKETLVAGGDLVMKRAEAMGVKILPVDSEHSAIFQSLMGNEGKEIKKILLTASGGPFRGKKRSELEKVTSGQALKHPNWNMGKKITIDSATMMNKGLEVIEAKWLFDVDVEKIEVLVHPQSILHSAVEYMDNAIIGQMGTPDMKVPISVALAYPERLELKGEEVDFFGKANELDFEKPDFETFKCLSLAIKAIKMGGTFPAVMNGANEVLVDYFLKDEIGFNEIGDIIEVVMNAHNESCAEYESMSYEKKLNAILMADEWARSKVHEVVKGGIE